MADDNFTDSEAYDKEYNSFMKQLEDFHNQRSTPFKRIPRINGKSIDLYLLYVVITSRGGWHKVNQRNEWEEILEDFRLPSGCVNARTALKQIYIRYLDIYERIHFLGEEGEDRSNDPDEDDSRSARAKKANLRNLNTVPLSYNHQQHNVTDGMRAGNGLSTDLWKQSQYDKLAMSLTCPLPNEHDFSFNLCTLLSNEGKHVMQLSQCERLVNLIIAHTGVFNDCETQKYFLSNYKSSKGKSLLQFWVDVIKEKSALELLTPSIIKAEEMYRMEDRTSSDKEETVNSENNVNNLSNSINKETTDNEDNSVVNNNNDNSNDNKPVNNEEHKVQPQVALIDDTRQAQLTDQFKKVFDCELNISNKNNEIFHHGRDIGHLDAEGTRITQVLHILRNLSFEENNVSSLAKSSACVRFLILCVWSNWGGLAVGGLDALGNIAPEVRLRNPIKDKTSSLLLSCVCQGICSQDRALVLRSLEVLNKLAMCDPNEEVLSYNIAQTVYDQICRYLAIHDIMLLIYTLESLYSLSSLGTPSCNSIVRASGCIHTLVSLLTVEAQSYGPEACIGMKVVETVTGVVADSDSTTQSQNTTSVATSAAINTPPPVTVTKTPAVTSTPGTPLEGRKIGGRIVPPDLEEFVTDWVLKNYESNSGNSLEQQVMYRHFAAAMHASGRKQGLTPVLLSNCVRKVFGTSVGPSRRPIEDGTEKWHYNNIKKRDGSYPTQDIKRLPPTPVHNAVVMSTNHVGTPVMVMGQRTLAKPEPSSTPISPILKAQLSAPLRPSSPTIRQQTQAQVGLSPHAGPSLHHPKLENSSLIKSLLANKVTGVQYRPSPPYQPPQAGGSVVTSSPIRPQMQVSKNIQKSHLNTQESSEAEKTASCNGVITEIKSEENSNSVNSGGSETKFTSFEGILQNGVKNEKDVPQKNVLADLLEKTVGGDILNGVVDKDLRINDKEMVLPTNIKANGPLTTNGQVKRPATPDSSPVKRFALEDPQLGQDGRITLYVSQNGNESGEVISQGGHQVVLSQGQQPATNQDHSTINSQVVLNQGQQQTTVIGSHQSQVIHSNNIAQTVVTPQGQVMIQRPPAAQVIHVSSPQMITAPSQSTPVMMSSAQSQPQGQIIQQVIQHGNSQRVILHQGQLGQVLAGGQMILQQGTGGQQVVVQGSNNIQGQVIVQGSNSGQLVVGGGQQVMVSTGQMVIPSSQQTQVVGSTTGGMILTNSQGQQILVSSQQGQQVVVNSGGQQQTVVVSSGQGQPGHVVVPNNSMGGTMLLASQTQGAAPGKTLIILPNQKVVMPGGQVGAGQQVVIPRQVGQQVVQVVSNNSNVNGTPIRTVTKPSVPATAESISTSSPIMTTPALSVAAIAPAPAGPAAVPVTQVTTTPQSSLSSPQPRQFSRPKNTGLQYRCEWRGCHQIFSSPGQVYHHACKVHCPAHITELTCQWAGCDAMTRKRFSTMTHIHDRHCNEQLLQILAVRQQQLATLGKTEIPIPQAPPPHPGYAPNAAFHAIKRHALEVITQRDAVEKEGPVTKSIRLTAALILRNLVIYSNHGKKLLRGYESQLSNVAISAMESSRTVAQILYDIHLNEQSV